MFVIGTAGHIDHGKSTLIRALTGIDPDRLREEKERGMTIDLGFAWLKLPGGREVGVVDVPGHERFIKNMLAGVGGIDLALLIVAANEGVMPQTREHLSILDLLKVKRGIVVLTKKDTVDDDLLTLVKMEVEELVAATVLAGAPVIAVSATTREGLDDLMRAIDKLLDSTEPRRDLGRPRLPIDRIFTIAGAGTVVTGTLIDGTLSTGDEVEIVPPGLKSRIRGLQTHKSKINTAEPGSRVAVNLVGINVDDLTRGDVVTKPGWLAPARMLTIRLSLLPYLPRPLRHNTIVTLFTGAAEAEARLRLLQAEQLKPGQEGWAQLVLDGKLAAVPGDRFIIRSPMETLGGGEIVDIQSRRQPRFKADVFQNLEARQRGSAADSLLAYLEQKQPLEAAALASQANLPPGEAANLAKTLVDDGRVIMVGSGERAVVFTAAGWKRLGERTAAMLRDYHQKYPARSGIPRIELASRLKLGNNGIPALEKMIGQSLAVEEGAVLRLPDHRVRLTPDQQKKTDAFLKSLESNPFSPPTDAIPEPDLLNLLAEQRKVVKVSDGVIFSARAYDEMLDKTTSHIKEHGKVSLGEVRDIFKTSRKYAQAFLEYLDARKITKRVGDERVLVK